MNLVLIVFLPLLSFIICGLLRNILANKQAALIAVGAMGLSSILAIQMLWQSLQPEFEVYIKLGNWLAVDGFRANWALCADRLSIIMLSMVCVISAAVHMYSIGYMAGDERFNIFMAYLSLFTFFMLLLICADNLLQLFFGWEGVGLCSYLLIGFWYRKSSAANAAYKAFIVNRLADVAMLLAIILLAYHLGSVEFGYIEHSLQFLISHQFSLLGIKSNMLELICLLLFIGAMGKSAQIGLHIWLPDAMEGPTPVSALIHAATMVTAGVFLVARLNFLFIKADSVSHLMAWVGAATCLMAGLMAIWQNDIKKIIAYSTCSQLGYMFIACGLKAYHGAIFHLLTHAFFKAALFLAAGNVIHGTGGRQQLAEIGNVSKDMKATFAIFTLGSAAIMGIPPFAGFYSKDLILEYAAAANWLIFTFGILGAACTGFYSLKILGSIFTDKLQSAKTHGHEASLVMLASILPLVIGLVFAGFACVHLLSLESQSGYFAQVFKITPIASSLQGYIKFLPLLASIIGGIIGYSLVGAKEADGVLARVVKNDFYFEYLYEKIIAALYQSFCVWAALFDVYVVDGFLQKIVDAARGLGQKITRWQTGYVFDYSAVMLAAMCVSILVFAFFG